MIIHTASEGVSLARKLENDSAAFYEELAKQYSKDAETFLSFSRENKKNIIQFERAYYGVITDAIEGCYAFNIEADDYALDLFVAEGTGDTDVAKKAIKLEEKIKKYYEEAAEQSKSLMADVPRAFSLIAKKRVNRIEKLKTL
jgi:hypothetical protein